MQMLDNLAATVTEHNKLLELTKNGELDVTKIL